MSGQQEEDEYLSRIDEVKDDLRRALSNEGIETEDADTDVLITFGYLSDLLEFCQEHRSEIEELG